MSHEEDNTCPTCSADTTHNPPEIKGLCRTMANLSDTMRYKGLSVQTTGQSAWYDCHSFALAGFAWNVLPFVLRYYMLNPVLNEAFEKA